MRAGLGGKKEDTAMVGGSGEETGEEKETRRHTNDDREGGGGFVVQTANPRDCPKSQWRGRRPVQTPATLEGKRGYFRRGIAGYANQSRGQGEEAKKRENVHMRDYGPRIMTNKHKQQTGAAREKQRRAKEELRAQTESLREEKQVNRHGLRKIRGTAQEKKTRSTPKREITKEEKKRGGSRQDRS
ncbi:hypothetical protein NDU88_010772 [Pleurodeles waltl]|uniref:Uncharacterized protein n=1 Tax=Pleurodeles waltl TaxID=8319 RepID=A0AAV7PVV1_PLEWA|nr:hypothetical protein NDU88_010772 [Pleurodeles waltl]